MTEEIFSKVIDILLLIVCSAILSSSEAAFFSIQPNTLKNLAGKEKSYWNFFTVVYERPVDVLIMIILGNELVNITATAMMTALIISIFGDSWKFLAVIIMLPLLLIFGDILPKVIAIHYAERFSQFLALPSSLIYRLFLPLIFVFRKITLFFTSLITGLKTIERESVHDDLNVYLEIGEESGVLETSEKHLLQNIFNLDKIEVWEIMRSRREIFYIPYNTPDDILLLEVKKKGFAKIPVVENNIDDIKGVLHVKDLLAMKDSAGIKNWQNVLRKPEYVFRTKKIGSLLKDMKERNFTICFVVNEYGKVIGLVTMTDVLQTIFKGVASTTIFPGWMSEQLDDGSFIISQTMLVSLFNEFFNANLPGKNFRTMGRFLKSILGHNPQQGDSAEYEKWIFTVELSSDKKSTVIRVKEKENA
jgi:CBS domain containing-hemolysin-like protein